MVSSRAVLVLGMHRSGTSAVTRGLAALGVYLGDDFLETQPDNPTGYWEDKQVVAINERVLAALGLQWEDVAPIEREQFAQPPLEALRREAVGYLNGAFTSHALWGFKDPRTVRLLPFWRGVFDACAADDRYLVAIRNPLSVATSLFARQALDAAASHRLWLVYTVPYLREIAGKPFVVVDYDLLMKDPRRQLERVANQLELPREAAREPAIARFAAEFLDPNLRHSTFSRLDFDKETSAASLTREAYLWLNELATDRLGPRSASFWQAWESIEQGVAQMTRASATGP
jgi:hypothetical protein